MAKLYFYYGAMGSAKTATAIMTAFNYEEKGQKPILLKPETDTRDGALKIKSRIGLERECRTVEDFLEEYWKEPESVRKYDVIIVDEAQFCNKEDIDVLAEIVDTMYIPVICYGLRSDFQLNLFEGSERLLSIADEIHEVKTMCWCGSKATCNARIVDGRVTYQGEQIMLGANESYIPLCRRHYKLGRATKDWWELENQTNVEGE